MQRFSYRLSRGVTEIILGTGAISSLGELEDALVLFPESLEDLVKSHIHGSAEYIGISDGEESKTMETVIQVLDKLMVGNFKRNSMLISFGGGTVSDVAGFAASIYLRGIRYISVPTTLLSMVDASMGGKNGVNFKGVKNVLGTFYSPSEIIIDTSLVREMPKFLIEDGIGEIAKYAAILDIELQEFLMNNSVNEILEDEEKTQYLLTRCVKDKMDLVEQDEFDQKGIRAVLNYGHTIGHAIEALSGFSISHGRAVIGGMLMETDYAVSKGLVTPDVRKRIGELVTHLGFSVKREDYLPGPPEELMQYILSDKKSTRHTLKLPIPEKPGIPKVCEVELSSISDYLGLLK